MNKNSLANLRKERIVKTCSHCVKLFDCSNIKRHEKSCIMNPDNQKDCPVCKKNFSKKGVTCSYSCANTLFRSGKNNPNWKESGPRAYQSTCFHYHGKKCLVCGEQKIVAAHHVNKNHSDDRPENLVPLCPTHHQYVHSKYAEEIQPIIDAYLSEFIV